MNEIHPSMSGFAVSDKRLTPNYDLPRKCGEVGITWFLYLQSNLLVCAVIVTDDPVMTISVYLPTTDSSLDIYQEYLSDLENLDNYPQGSVIIAGDFNAHINSPIVVVISR